jgi:hypothetical protein
MPSILIDSTKEKPNAAILGVIAVFWPTCIRTVFSILHFKPLKVPNSSRQVFSASNAVKVKSVNMEVSSANASELSVSLFDSFLVGFGDLQFRIWNVVDGELLPRDQIMVKNTCDFRTKFQLEQ